MTAIEAFNNAMAALATAGAALVAENQAQAQQITTLTAERDALAAKVAAFTALADQLYALAHPNP